MLGYTASEFMDVDFCEFVITDDTTLGGDTDNTTEINSVIGVHEFEEGVSRLTVARSQMTGQVGDGVIADEGAGTAAASSAHDLVERFASSHRRR
jgi:hypothetical protein